MIIKTEKDGRKKNQKGAILLIAVTVASLVLSIGLGILNITSKEIVLSAYNRESGKAFYASNAGIECALFWDISYAKSKPAWTQSPFATSTDSIGTYSETEALSCAGQVFNPHLSFEDLTVVKGATTATTTFKFSTWSTSHGDPFDINNPCVEVIILKYEDNTSGIPMIKTKISSFGYNNCDETKKRRVSRGIRVTY